MRAEPTRRDVEEPRRSRAKVATVEWSPGGCSGTFGVAGTPR